MKITIYSWSTSLTRKNGLQSGNTNCESVAEPENPTRKNGLQSGNTNCESVAEPENPTRKNGL
ncbi:hypothetical protein ACPXCX_39580, partial [Streptomyces sp. DT225]